MTTERYQEYIEALKESANYQTDPVGISRCSPQTRSELEKIKQHNVIIELIIRLHRRLDKIEIKIAEMKNPTPTKTIENDIDKLIKQMENWTPNNPKTKKK